MTPPATVGGVLRAGAVRLAEAGLETPRLDAEVLLRHVLGWDRTALFLHAPDPIAAVAVADFNELLQRRLEGVPVAYLTGHRAFLDFELRVTDAVLVPRPETELLVEWARDWLARNDGRAPAVVDVGTGSGAIALGLASLLSPHWPGTILGIDISPEALSVAIGNRDRLGARVPSIGIVGRVEFRAGDLLAGQAGPLDLILANLPYLTPEQVDGNPDLGAEPRLALDGGPDGLNLIRVLIGQSVTLLRAGGVIALELDPSQAVTVASLLAAAFPGAIIETHRDLAGHDRFVTADLSGKTRA
ncbi:MAG TPA: peptide chain release factor N(5)-glutamine methyltransferase [Thermomicrobiales bacterium]|jgi:release factor glutamine methyltransferase|nr:peptide chain release factor N(5)-glutamine methyltransferase [Thermomicrobiales bacterium]